MTLYHKRRLVNVTLLKKTTGNEQVTGVLPYIVATYEGAALKWKEDRLLPGGGWVTRASATDNNWTSVCWSPELSLFVAVSQTGVGNRVMTGT